MAKIVYGNLWTLTETLINSFVHLRVLRGFRFSLSHALHQSFLKYSFHIFTFISLLLCCTPALSENVAVHHQEGVSHGFLVLRSLDGQILASGDQIQVVQGNIVTVQTVFHFKDGSIQDETTIYSQDHVFRLLSEHMIQKGPSFPHPIDAFVNPSSNEIKVLTPGKNNQKETSQHMNL
ncbi:MAG: hypothetical protein ACRD3Q_22395, partial [Terriglobales bacterium]